MTDILGYVTYAPMFSGAVFAPVFPMYAFFAFDLEQDERWPVINDDRDVVRLLPMHRPHPVPIPDRLMEQCREREAAGEFVIQGGRLSLKYRPGDDVSIAYGAYRGFAGKWVRQERSMARLLMEMFGALREISVPVGFVAT